jgi:hypothetical protein
VIFLINRFTLKDQWFDSHRLPKSNMAPRGNLNFFECTFNLKISYEQLLFVSFDYILMFFSLFSDSAAFFCFICHLFWRVNQMSESRRFVFRVSCFVFRVSRFAFRVEGRTFVVFNESLPMVWRSLCLPVRPADETARWGKVGETPLRWRPLLFSHVCFGN